MYETRRTVGVVLTKPSSSRPSCSVREAGQDRSQGHAPWTRYVVFQLAEVAVPRALFAEIDRFGARSGLAPGPSPRS
jgi:hypothetical protein